MPGPAAAAWSEVFREGDWLTNPKLKLAAGWLMTGAIFLAIGWRGWRRRR